MSKRETRRTLVKNSEIQQFKEYRSMIFLIAAKFPGLVDGETEVSGADLVECLTEEFDNLKFAKIPIKREEI